MPLRPDMLTTALEPLQRRVLLPDDFQSLGSNVLRAANNPKIRDKYELMKEGGIISWYREGTGFALDDKGAYLSLAATRITEGGIRYTDSFAFGDKDVVPYGISLVAHELSYTGKDPEISQIRFLRLAREQGKYKLHEHAIKNKRPYVDEVSLFKLSLGTIGMLPDQ